jgi:hypothetical protein
MQLFFGSQLTMRELTLELGVRDGVRRREMRIEGSSMCATKKDNQ